MHKKTSDTAVEDIAIRISLSGSQDSQDYPNHCHNSSNLEAEWSSFEKKFNWFLVAIGADKKT